MGDRDFYINMEGKQIKVSEEVYREYYRGERKERYFMKDLKESRVCIDPKTGAVTIIPGREDSYERLVETNVQFASPENVEEQIIHSKMLKQALGKLSRKERRLIEELYYLEKTERQACEALHIATRTLQKRHNETLKKLREYFDL